MKILPGKSLADMTTFRIDGEARFFCSVASTDDLREAIGFAKAKNLPLFVIGGGSNVLVSDAGFDGLVVKVDIRGIEELENSFVRVEAGENWDDFVAWTVERGYGGLENLSLIPGSVGAA